MIIALLIAILVTGAVYLILQRGMVRIVLGMSLLSHAANLTILAAGIGRWRGESFVDPGTTDPAALAELADPIPQAFVLTAIVISMATTAIMLTMASFGRTDDTYARDTAPSTQAASTPADADADGKIEGVDEGSGNAGTAGVAVGHTDAGTAAGADGNRSAAPAYAPEVPPRSPLDTAGRVSARSLRTRGGAK